MVPESRAGNVRNPKFIQAEHASYDRTPADAVFKSDTPDCVTTANVLVSAEQLRLSTC
jgi:hypothetical protein